MQIFPSIDIQSTQASGSQSSGQQTAAVMMRSKTSSDFDQLLNGAFRDEATTKISKTAPSETIEPTDILYLQEILSQMGVPKDQLANLGQLMVNGQKAGVADLEAALTDKGYKKLSSLNKMDMETFLQKLGFMPEQAETLISGLENGKTTDVWAAIQKKLSGHALEDLSAEDFSALTQALRLNENAQKAMEGILEKMKTGSPDALEAAKNALSLIAKAMEQQASADTQIKKTLEKAMPDVLKNMEQRLAGQDQASTRVSRDEQYLSTMMRENSVSTATGNMARDALTRQSQEQGGNRENGAEQETFAKKWSLFEQNKDTAESSRKTGRENAIESIIDKMSSKISMSSQTLLNPEATSAIQNREPSFAQALQQGSLSSRQAESVLLQMEKGMLQSLADGTKQLSLQLNPEELGAVNIILSVRSKEVSATIRPESPEVARAVEHQIHKIQAVLEQQGFKVQRLEVQTQLPENREFMNWQGTDQHNQECMQRENARRARLARLRSTESSSLAQNMQNTGVREKVSQYGLNLIA